MRELLLHLTSPELLSRIGFLLLAFGLLGEVGVYVLSPKWEALHGILVFSFAALVLVGYLISHIGDDEAFRVVSERAQTAEERLHAINTPRIIDDSKYATLVACFKEAPKGPVYVRPGLIDRDAKPLGDRIESALKEAGFPAPPPWPSDPGDEGMFSWGTAGIILIVKGEQTPLERGIYRCLFQIGLKDVVGWTDPNHPDGAVSVGIGARF